MKSLFFLLLINFTAVQVFAQPNVVTGKITDKQGEKLSSVSVVVKETGEGTTTDNKGSFRLTTKKAFPFTLEFTSVGFQAYQIRVANTDEISITLQTESLIGQDVVVGATRAPIRLIESPVSIERLGLTAIQTTPSATYYDAIANLKGVDFTTSGLMFKTPSTRGFNGSGSARVNQLVDGMDNQAPGLNFFVGNFVGVTELDVENIELLPGASSALYGSGGMNGTILINSKNPFKYQGLSILMKEGIMNVDKRQRPDVTPYHDLSLRWAKAFGNRFAVKVAGQYIRAKDWLGDDSSNYLRTGDAGHLILGTRNTDPNYDGVNVYGDETNTDIKPYIPAAYQPFFTQKTIDVSRTGYAESDIVAPITKSLKLTGALHYKLSDNIEASLAAYWGKGSTVYTGSDRYAFNNAIIAQYKLEVRSSNWFIRGYTTQENAGDSYASTTLARQFNERWKPSDQWYNEYLNTYIPLYLSGTSDAQAHMAARAAADKGRPEPGSAQFQQIFEQLKKTPISKGGGLFLDKTDLWMAEGQYNLVNKFQFAEVVIGANYKEFILNSEGTIFIDTAGPIPVDEVGGYIQATKKLFNDHLILAASGRYDKNENFKGKFTPRYTALIKVANNNNIRISYQTAYRFPTTEQQYIKLQIGSNVYLDGGLPWIVEDMGKRVTDLTGAPYTYKEFKPETCNSFEAGYKGLIADKLLIDVYGYISRYKDFIGRKLVINQSGTIYSIVVNSENKVRTYGFGASLNYMVSKSLTATGNFYSDKITDVPSGFIASYNTPPYRANVGISNTGFGKQKRWGFAIQYRWQDSFTFENDFANGDIQAFSTVDAQVNYKIIKNKAELRVGGSNIINHYYKNGFGSPAIGGLYYLAVRLDL
ncbi:MAG: TonB-dependent receptor [Segetibacter sp.]|nr:TonB-dependent receptor [Segetibacter sp.]